MQGQRCLRCGFTLFELLVSITIIVLLLSLIAPAIQNAREVARRLQCANRLRNVGVAISGWSDSRRRFPAAASMSIGGDKEHPAPNHNWVVEILPFLDRQDLGDRWDKNEPAFSAGNEGLASSYLSVLVCPSDFTVRKKGDLSFAVNGGIGESVYYTGIHDFPVDPFYHALDLNGNGVLSPATGIGDGKPSDRELLKSMGMFFTENYGFSDSEGYQGTVRHHTPATIYDGMSNTLMVTENVRTGFDPYEPSANWATTDTRRSRVYFSYRVCGGNVCSPVNVDYSKANSGDHAINAALSQPEGEAPWPSSGHSGGINAVFADGHLTFMDEGIDGLVYASLFSPDGRKLIGLPLDQGVQQGF